MSEQIVAEIDAKLELSPALQEKLNLALDKVFGKDDKPEPGERRLTQAEYDLRIEYARLSWRLVSQIGPFNFRAQADILLQSMALSKILGDEEEGFIAKVKSACGSAGMSPVQEKSE